jgi:hypothetical protein
MRRKKPYIPIGSTTLVKDRTEFKNFVLNVIIDTFIYEVQPDTIELDAETNTLFTLYLLSKRIIIDALEVDDYRDYIDVYLYGVKQPQDRYNVNIVGENIVVQFNTNITRLPQDVTTNDFIVKGKIVDRT